MKEPQRIKLSTEKPIPKEVIKHRSLPLNKTEWDAYGQDNDDMYVPIDLDKINKLLDENNENNSQDN
jgi:hypothetical protein